MWSVIAGEVGWISTVRASLLLLILQSDACSWHRLNPMNIKGCWHHFLLFTFMLTDRSVFALILNHLLSFSNQSINWNRLQKWSRKQISQTEHNQVPVQIKIVLYIQINSSKYEIWWAHTLYYSEILQIKTDCKGKQSTFLIHLVYIMNYWLLWYDTAQSSVLTLFYIYYGVDCCVKGEY